MQIITSNKHVSYSRAEAQSETLEALSTKLKSDLLPVVERWKQQLGEQIRKHPQMALGAGLLSGVVLGWWVKR